MLGDTLGAVRGGRAESYAIRRETGPCEPLRWDSEHFGFPTARATRATLTPAAAGELDSWCHAHRIRCLYLLADSADAETARAAAASGFRDVDTRLGLHHDLDGVAAPDRGRVKPSGCARRRPTSCRSCAGSPRGPTAALASTSTATSPLIAAMPSTAARLERAQDGEGSTILVPEVGGEAAGYQAIGPFEPGETHPWSCSRSPSPTAGAGSAPAYCGPGPVDRR